MTQLLKQSRQKFSRMIHVSRWNTIAKSKWTRACVETMWEMDSSIRQPLKFRMFKSAYANMEINPIAVTLRALRVSKAFYRFRQFMQDEYLAPIRIVFSEFTSMWVSPLIFRPSMARSSFYMAKAMLVHLDSAHCIEIKLDIMLHPCKTGQTKPNNNHLVEVWRIRSIELDTFEVFTILASGNGRCASADN